MKTDFIIKGEMLNLLSSTMPTNRLILEICLYNGLRLGDVLNFRTCKLSKRFVVFEQKTGKKRIVRLTESMYQRAVACSGKIFVFESRVSVCKSRTRQAVWKDLKRSARLFRVKVNIAPHSTRKVFAVEEFKKGGDIKHVQQLLNHSDEVVTFLYAYADILTARKMGKNHT